MGRPKTNNRAYVFGLARLTAGLVAATYGGFVLYFDMELIHIKIAVFHWIFHPSIPPRKYQT